MPWRQKPKKDVISCDKPRGAANKLRSGDLRIGKPHVRLGKVSAVRPRDSPFETTQGSETSQYLEEKKKIFIPLVAASEKGEAQIQLLLLI